MIDSETNPGDQAEATIDELDEPSGALTALAPEAGAGPERAEPEGAEPEGAGPHDAVDGGTEDGAPSTKLAALDDEGDIAADYLEELLDIADLDGDIDTFTEGGRAHVSIVTDTKVLVGKDGEVLEALQELARLAVMTETGKRSRLMLDIAGYREQRRKELTDVATDAVQEVKATGESVRLAPMNPFERKIVHDVVAAGGLSSESDGEEPNRRVVVLPS